MENTENKRIYKAALIGIVFPATLGVLKLLVGLLTNSISIVSAALDSMLDLLSTTLAYPAIKKSKTPPDEDHPYGHGKFENLFSIIQGLIIITTGVYITIGALRRFINPVEFEALPAGIAVILISGISTFFLGNWIKNIGKKTDSIILIAEGENFLADVYSNIGILIVLTIVEFTGLEFVDTIGGLVISIVIIQASIKIFKRSINDLLDRNLPPDIVNQITEIVEKHKEQYLNFHKLRTRRAGSVKMVDFHLTLCRMMHVAESHELVYHIEEEIKEKVPNSDVIIHSDPCYEVCAAETSCRFINHLDSHHHLFAPEGTIPDDV
ncbi:cation diffusion facilitator family transporter [bacterium]|nr:cation diffusion facilitator family transporter [bacterium]